MRFIVRPAVRGMPSHFWMAASSAKDIVRLAKDLEGRGFDDVRIYDMAGQQLRSDQVRRLAETEAGSVASKPPHR